MTALGVPVSARCAEPRCTAPAVCRVRVCVQAYQRSLPSPRLACVEHAGRCATDSAGSGVPLVFDSLNGHNALSCRCTTCGYLRCLERAAHGAGCLCAPCMQDRVRFQEVAESFGRLRTGFYYDGDLTYIGMLHKFWALVDPLVREERGDAFIAAIVIGVDPTEAVRALLEQEGSVEPSVLTVVAQTAQAWRRYATAYLPRTFEVHTTWEE